MHLFYGLQSLEQKQIDKTKTNFGRTGKITPFYMEARTNLPRSEEFHKNSETNTETKHTIGNTSLCAKHAGSIHLAMTTKLCYATSVRITFAKLM
ncbi:hypothetical protein TNCT_714911 [Trichonephila clavata]|uniref:Uncharacterized protein n=1 Tax=Trichonephila clavata TaxID=2740835 RepID=A0A8X6JYZ7_TRICU|nr:hypothetical protein TNCT_714911 [Trichonephila clavata]